MLTLLWASATQFIFPLTCQISAVNSATADRWRACHALHRSTTMLNMVVMGFWSVKTVNLCP